MIIKKKFTLLKDTPNTISLSKSVIKAFQVENGPRKSFVIIKLIEDRIKHFTKDPVIDFISRLSKRESIEIVNMPNYLLPVTFNTTTNSVVINLTALGNPDISKIDPKNLYAAFTYGLCFSSLVTEQVKISEVYCPSIVGFLLGIFTRLFGKEFGLLGIYATEISKLKFLISCYILESFFGLSRDQVYKRATSISSFSHKDIEHDLDQYDFSKIEDFITSLSSLNVMPGLNKYSFTSKFLKLFGHSFLPALEDGSRFISTITTSSLSGTNVVPTFINKYNEYEYSSLLEISKNIFKKI